MSNNPFKVEELKSFRIFKYPNGENDKGIGIVKVISLDKVLCDQIQKVRSRYLVSTAELYYNSTENIDDIIEFDKYFDFHLVSCERIKNLIISKKPNSKVLILGAGEYITSPNIFKLNNYGKRKTTFLSTANSFWKVKNHHNILEIQKYLLDKGIHTTSKIVCGIIKDHDYLEFCRSYAAKNLKDGMSRIIIGASIEELVKIYNDSQYVVHSSSMDSSPRVIFEGILCGVNACIVKGKWAESLNKWLDTPLIFRMDKIEDIMEIMARPKNIEINKEAASQIGLINLKGKIVDFCNKELGTYLTTDGFIDYSIVGKKTFLGDESKYNAEILKLRKLIS